MWWPLINGSDSDRQIIIKIIVNILTWSVNFQIHWPYGKQNVLNIQKLWDDAS